MKVNLIQKNTTSKYSTIKNGQSMQNVQTSTPMSLTKDNFSSKVKFTGYVWRTERLNILGRSAEGMKELGEYFHKLTSWEINQASVIKGFWGKKESETRMAKARLQTAIDQVKENRATMLKELSELKIKQARELENMAAQKIRIKSGFIDDVVAEGKKENAGKDFGISNGIMVYGNSKALNEKFINWLKQETPASFYKIKFNHEKPLATLAEIEKLAQDGEKSFQVNQKRSIIEVEEMDDFFADDNTVDKRTLISAFKRIEHLHQKHSTILMRTIKPLENFDDASTGSQRFDFKVPMKSVISESEIIKIKELEAKIKKLDDKADDVYGEFRYWEDEGGGGGDTGTGGPLSWENTIYG